MPITPEKKVKNKVVAILKELGCYYFYPVTGGYGSSGVPDIVGSYYGKFFGIECKADAKKKPTPLQMKNLQEIAESGGIAMVIHDDNVNDVRHYLTGKNPNPQQLEFDFGE